MTAANANLFDPGPPRYAARGRGATPQVQRVDRLERPNPAGRFEITYRYRPLQGWSSTQIAAAERLARLYFEQLGGFRIADDALIRTIIETLRVYSFEELVWAVLAKRASVSMRDGSLKISTLRFIASPVNFFGTGQIDRWVEQSREFQLRTERKQSADRISTQQQTRAQERRDQAAKLAQDQNDIERRAAFLAGLTPEQLAEARAAVEPKWRRSPLSRDSKMGRPVYERHLYEYAWPRWGGEVKP